MEITDEELRHIFIEIDSGRGAHGTFLRSFAKTIVSADPENFAIMRPVSIMIIRRYELARYLDTINGGVASF